MRKELTGQAKNAVALAFADLGDIAGLVKWAKSSAHNRATFYRDIYPKLIPLQLTGTVTASVDDSNDALDALERIFSATIDAHDAAAPSVAGAAVSIIDNTTYSRSTSAEPSAPAPPPSHDVAPTLTPPPASAANNKPSRERPAQPAIPGACIGVLDNLDADQSTTARFYRWYR